MAVGGVKKYRTLDDYLAFPHSIIGNGNDRTTAVDQVLEQMGKRRHVTKMARSSPAFLAEPDRLSRVRSQGHPAFGDYDDTGLSSYGGRTERSARLAFGVVWATVDDVAGAVVSRAQGLNASLLHRPEPFLPGPDERPFPERFDNTDVYRLLYLTLFGERLPTGVGRPAADR